MRGALYVLFDTDKLAIFSRRNLGQGIARLEFSILIPALQDTLHKSFNKYRPTTYYVSGAVVGSGDIVGNNLDFLG